MRIERLTTRRRSSPPSVLTHAGLDYQPWVPWLTSGVVVTFALLSSIHHHGVRAHPAALALIWLSVAPWLLELVDVVLSRVAFGLAVLIPQAVLHVGGIALGIDDLTDESPTQMGIMIALFAVGELAATSRWRVAAPFAVATAGIIVGRGLVQPEFDGGIFWAAGTLMALAIGYMMRRQAETTFQLREAQDALASEAVAQERHRIAREVHDAIAHSLTVTMMHVTAARMALRRDEDEAAAALEEAERLGRQSLADIRRTVGLLRDGPTTSVEPPQPDAEDLQGLVDDSRAAGMDVSFELDGDLARLPPSAGLAVYRIVQESLTNARKHAPGAAVRVSVRTADDAVDLRIENGPGYGPRRADRYGTGMGIVGMRERAALLGGTLEAGPAGDGWSVRCRFPLEERGRGGSVRSAPGREAL